ncbi:unnamed protein product [Penicillium roqueforti FM164]|uniref:Genomic scaffold, ProqFM164S01 n=1 Tax=Penicillium roqueforti (strain FM164) TaxID=1365484 RepID=W6QAQ9_PENRF|nr:unnamed protein product [Penicillium roqueforti FM164]
MCFGSSRREPHDSPPPGRRIHHSPDAYSQSAYTKDYKRNKRRAGQNAGAAGGGDGVSGDGGGGCG